MPGWLERIVPRVDVEGHALARDAGAAAATPGEAERPRLPDPVG
ncbi:hypothetical protein ACFWFI_03670 [Streptomyces sp. NPDC060209]